jgi:serine/threonine protein kinase
MDLVRAKRIAAELLGRPVGGWVVKDYLGNGASAVVLSAKRDGVLAALKLIDPEMVERHGQEKQLMRIERERDLVGHSNEHLVKIFDGGLCLDTNYLYIVMELMPHPAHRRARAYRDRLRRDTRRDHSNRRAFQCNQRRLVDRIPAAHANLREDG